MPGLQADLLGHVRFKEGGKLVRNTDQLAVDGIEAVFVIAFIDLVARCLRNRSLIPYLTCELVDSEIPEFREP